VVGLNLFVRPSAVAAVVGFCVSYIFLRKQRGGVDIGHLRANKDRDRDSRLEASTRSVRRPSLIPIRAALSSWFRRHRKAIAAASATPNTSVLWLPARE
jgi:hypothetical protein